MRFPLRRLLIYSVKKNKSKSIVRTANRKNNLRPRCFSQVCQIY